MGRFLAKELELKGSFLIIPFSSTDERGSFVKDFSSSEFKKMGIDYDLSEVFYTYSHRGVIRALHFQEVNHQPKLVRCVKGKIYDVIVDLRPNSSTFKQWLGFYLTEENRNELLIPAHFGHGYLVIDDSIVSYKCSSEFDAEHDSGIMFNDCDLNIKWPFEEIGGKDKIIISEKDKKLQSFKDYFARGCK